MSSKYTFSWYGWVPGYNDFDQVIIEITAQSEDEAWKFLENNPPKFNKSEPALIAIDGVPVLSKCS